MEKLLSLSQRALKYAVKAHGDQKYGNELPYKVHLLWVMNTLREFGFDIETMLAVAALHDVLEDTHAQYEELVTLFGEVVAITVATLTEPKGGNRKWRHEQTYPRIARNDVAIIVKLADRIANVETGGSKIAMYRKEHANFKEALYGHMNTMDWLGRVNAMWTYLDDLISNINQQD